MSQVPLTPQHLAFDLADACQYMEQVKEKLKAKGISLSEVGDIEGLMESLSKRFVEMTEKGEL